MRTAVAFRRRCCRSGDRLVARAPRRGLARCPLALAAPQEGLEHQQRPQRLAVVAPAADVRVDQMLEVARG